ncbi:MAG: hypothetical protein ACTSQJ_03475 [Promethearchaeota archaeon]
MKNRYPHKENYNIIIVNNDFYPSIDGNKAIQFNLKIPKICPICGKNQVIREEKIYCDNKKKQYLKVWLCEQHSKLKSEFPPKYILIYFIFMIIFILISITSQINYFYLFYLIAPCFLCYIAKKTSIIRDYLSIEFFKFKSVLSILNQNWTDEFLRLNALKTQILKVDFSQYEALL